MEINGKYLYCFRLHIFFYKNGSGSQTAESGNSSGINGNTKTGKYDRKIYGNRW
jgi:hypothetical protein